jgi:hypothetical protein
MVCGATGLARERLDWELGMAKGSTAMDFYLIWFDDDRKKPATAKITEAMDAYERRFHRHPNVILVSEQEQLESGAAVNVRSRTYIRPSHFYVGYEDLAKAA